jgi:hypothetical protein
MSAAAIKFLRNNPRTGLTPSDRLVLSAIAYGMENGQSSFLRPRKWLKDQTGLSLDTVKRSLKRLARARAIEPTARRSENGRRESNRIAIAGFADLSSGVQTAPLQGSKLHPSPSANCTPTRGANCTPLYKEQKKREEKEEIEDLRVADSRDLRLELIPSETSPSAPLEAFHSYNRTAEEIGLPIARSLPPGRRKSINARFREHGPESWSTVLANIRASDFLHGKNDRGWRPNFDWIVKPENYAKILEGNYAPTTPAPKFDRTDKVFVPSRWGPGKWVPKATEAVQ